MQTMKYTATALDALSTAGFLCLVAPAQQPAQGGGTAKPPLYNTTKQKLLERKQAFSYMQSKAPAAGSVSISGARPAEPVRDVGHQTCTRRFARESEYGLMPLALDRSPCCRREITESSCPPLRACP